MKNILIILLLLINSVIQVQATVYHVAASGGDFSTLAQVTAHTFVAGDQVLFNRGETFYGSLEIKQSGTSGSRIIYGAYGTGANPIITGFTTVSAWTDLGSNIWESTSAVSALSTLNMVTVNGVNTAMGRYPNADAANSGYLTYQTSTTTSITSSSLTGTPDWTNAELVVRTRYYFYFRELITSQSSGTLHWTSAISPSNGYGFFIQNDARALDQQNEWYYNPSTKKIKMYSVGQPSDVKVASVAYPIWFSNTNSPTSYITVENIDINGSNSEAIFRWSFGSTANKAHHIIINNCNVTDAGISGVSMGGNNLTVSNCNVTDVNGTAINVGYDQVSTITDNTMNNVGLLMGMCQTSSAYYYGAVCGINASHNAHSLIQYNRIINVGYDGINAGGSGTHATTVSNNFIQNYCLTQGDGGGIYWNNGASITCSYNIIIHGVAPIAGTNQSFAQAVGLYLDDSADSSEVSYNTVYDASCYGVQMNTPYHINLHHNTIYASGRNDIRIQRWASRAALVGNIINNNKFISNSLTQKLANFVSIDNDIPAFAVMNNNYYARPLGETTTISISQPSTGAVSYTLSEWKTFSSQDAASLGTPKTITDTLDLQFYYNDHKTDSVIVVNQRSIDMAGTVYSGNTTLAPFTALVLIKDATTTNYYVSNAGNDSNDGKSTALPIATLPKVNSLSLVAGDNVFFKRGDSWFGQLVPVSGSSSGVITYGAYGTGEKPIIHQAVSMNSTSDWTNESGNVWKNAALTLGSELSTNLTDVSNYSGISMTFTSPAVGSGAVDAVDYYSSPKSWKVTATTTGGVNSKILMRNNTGFAITKDHYYMLSFYAKSTANISPIFSIITTDWVHSIANPVAAITTGYTKFELVFKATDTYASVMFVGYLGLLPTGNTINFDDISVKEIISYPFVVETGNVLFNSDALVGTPKYATVDLANQGDFFSDYSNHIFRLYSVGNPASFYSNIKLLEGSVIIDNANKSYITLENLAVKYGGTSGIGYGGSATYQTIRNCEVSWCGGKQWNVGNPVRLGNGIDFYGNSHDNLVENCKIWEIYDAGMSNQQSTIVAVITQSNITYRNNQVWNCEYSYEYFNNGTVGTSATSNITIENNTCYNAGGGWSHSKRPDPTGYHVRIAGTPTNTTNFIIRNNIFDTSTSAVIANFYASNNLYSIDYNDLRSATGNIGYLNGTSYSTFSGYKTASGWDTHSVNADPLFLSTATKNFNIYLQSPAINVGDPTSPLDPDGTRADMGALPFDFRTTPIINALFHTRLSSTGKTRLNSSGFPYVWP